MAAFAVAFIGSLPAEGSGTAYQRMSLRWTRFEGAIAISPRTACGRRAREFDGIAGQGLGKSNREPVSPAGLELENATVFLQPVADHLEALEQYHGAAADLLAGATAAMEAAYAMTRRGGAVVVAGLPDPQQKFVIPRSLHSPRTSVRSSTAIWAVVSRSGTSLDSWDSTGAHACR